jgi:hypothetical protein
VYLSDPITVRVTADDIANGVKNNCFECPVARAILRAIGVTGNPADSPVHVVEVNDCDVWIDHDTNGRLGTGYYISRYDLPDDAANFIGVFDEWGSDYVDPFTFTLTPPGGDD